MTCPYCGAIFEKKHPRQKHCPDCVYNYKKLYYQANKAKYLAYQAQYRQLQKIAKTIQERTQKLYVAGTGCTRYKTCLYGSQRSGGIGRCDYHDKTGHCKIIEINGRKTVAPTKDCPFYKKRGNTK